MAARSRLLLNHRPNPKRKRSPARDASPRLPGRRPRQWRPSSPRRQQKRRRHQSLGRRQKGRPHLKLRLHQRSRYQKLGYRMLRQHGSQGRHRSLCLQLKQWAGHRSKRRPRRQSKPRQLRKRRLAAETASCRTPGLRNRKTTGRLSPPRDRSPPKLRLPKTAASHRRGESALP